MALVNASGGPFNAETVKNNNGTILNAGNVAGDGPMANNLDVSASTSNEKYPSLKPRTGSASETQDGAGAQAAVSGNPFAYDSSSDQWVMFGNGVTEGLESRDYTGNLDTDSTESARQIDHFISYGSGSAYNILARPSTNLRSGFTRPTGGGTDFTFIDPNTGLALSGVDLSATRKNPGQLRFNLGGRPIKATYWKVDEVEDYGGGFIAVDTDGDGEAEFYIPLVSLYPSDGIHEDAFIFEVNTALSGMITDTSFTYYRGPQQYLLSDTGVSPTTFKLPTVVGGYYDCTIDWGDGGEPESFVSTDGHAPSGAPSHTYSSAGTYEIKVVGDFRGLAGRPTMRSEFVVSSTTSSYDSSTNLGGTRYGTSNGAFDALKITKIKRWGTKLRLLPDDLSSYRENPRYNSSSTQDSLYAWEDGRPHLGLAGMYLNFDANWWSFLKYNSTGRVGTNFVAPYLQAGQSFSTVGGTAINYAKGISHLPIHSEYILEDNGASGLNLSSNRITDSAGSYINYPLVDSIYIPHGIDHYTTGSNRNPSDVNLSGVSPDGSESGVIDYDFIRYPAKAGISFLSRDFSIASRFGGPLNRRIAQKLYPNLDPTDFSWSADVGIPLTRMPATLSDPNAGISRDNDNNALNLYNEQKPYLLVDLMERGTLSHLTDPADNLIDLSGYQMKSKILGGNMTSSQTVTANTVNDYIICGSGFKNAKHMNLSGCKAMSNTFANYSVRFFNSNTSFSVPVSASDLQDLNGLDVSSVEDMNRVFANLRITGTWNGVSGWDVSNVSSMEEIFVMNHTGTLANVRPWRPNITETSGCFRMFGLCESEDGPEIFEEWLNAGCIKNADGAFSNFRQNSAWSLASITGWDVSSVTSMDDMFENSCVTDEARNFTYDLSNWDVSNVKSMQRMFKDYDTNYNRSTTFSPNIGNWDVTSCENFTNMFYGQKFNEALNWDLTNCKVFNAFGEAWFTTADIYPTATLAGITLPASGSRMFYKWSGLSSHTEIGSLSTNHVTSLEEWFEQSPLGANLSSWDTSNVTNMAGTFNSATAVNGVESSIANWNTSNVTNMSSGFYNSETFAPYVGNWDVSSVTNFSNCFARITGVSVPITGWDTSSATDMYYMFENGDINTDISNWNVSSVTDMEGMFSSATAFNQPIGSWDVSSVTNMKSMFLSARSFNQDLSSWDVSSVTNMQNMFNGATGIAANNSLANWNTINVTDMSKMFYGGFVSEFNGSLSGLQTGNVQTMQEMFRSNKAFNQPIGSWDTSNVTNMEGMFRDADSFNQPIGSWDVSSVTTFKYTFLQNDGFNQDLSNWDVSSATSLVSMFSSSTFNNGGQSGIGNWNTSNVTNMSSMFRTNTVFNQPIGNWNTSNVTNMDSMFYGTAFNQPIGNWNTSNVTNMRSMFQNNTAFDQDISNWDISSATDLSYMFRYNNTFTNGGQPFYKPSGGWSFAHAPNIFGMFNQATGVSCEVKTDFLKMISDSAKELKGLNRTYHQIKGITSCGAEADSLRLNLVASGFTIVDQ